MKLRFNCKYKHLEVLMPEIIDRYLSGEKIIDLSKEYGTSHQTLERYLRKFSVVVLPWYKRYSGPNKNKPMHPNVKEALRKVNTGKKFSADRCKKLSIRMSGNKNPNFGNGDKIRGNKNPNWLGGISLGQNQYRMFKEDRDRILKRDLHQCLLCHQSTSRLNVHHIDYNRKNSEDNNLMALCPRCHTTTNFNREFWTQFFWRIV
jgi:hypothetical protein